MSNWKPKLFKFNNAKIEEKDLRVVKNFNTTSRSGQIYTIPDFEDTLIKGKNKSNIYLWNLICEIRNWHFSKFNYVLPKGLDKQIIENTLLIYGRVAIFKYGEGYKAFPFRVDKLDMDGRPSKIEVYSPYMTNYKKKLTVGEDVVIFYNNNDGLIFTISDNIFFGTLWRVWSLMIDVVESKDAIYNTYKMNVPKIAISEVNAEEKDRLRESLYSGDILLDYDAKGYNEAQRFSGETLNTVIETKPMIVDMWNNFQNYLELLYTSLGMNHNPNNGKRERQINQEVQSNNQLLVSQITTELEIRKQQIEKFNEIFNEKMSIELNELFKEEENIKLGEEDENNNRNNTKDI